MTDPWLQELMEMPHDKGLPRAISILDKRMGRLIGDPTKESFEILHDMRDEVRTGANLVMEAGRRWAQQFMPKGTMRKASGYYDWDLDRDIDDILQSIKESPSPEIHRTIHEAISKGEHPQAAVSALAKNYQVHRARDIARTVLMNVYAKGALREMARHGYTEAIRIEIDDRIRCMICDILHNQVYVIADIMDLPNPLTEDSHPRCRGSFIPVVNSGVVRPDGKQIKHTEDFALPGGKKILKAPSEFAMFLKRFFTKYPIPFNVHFDAALPMDARMEKGILRVNPKTLIDQDPREVILEAWAQRLWPKYQKQFEDQYMLLTKMGLVHPSKSVATPQEYWVSEFIAYKTNRLQQPYEVLWFRTTVKE